MTLIIFHGFVFSLKIIPSHSFQLFLALVPLKGFFYKLEEKRNLSVFVISEKLSCNN